MEYKEQIDCANEISKKFSWQKQSLLLVTEPQQGKTGVITSFMKQIHLQWAQRECITGIKRPKFIIFTHISQNSIVDQTNERLANEGFVVEDPDIFTTHLNNPKITSKIDEFKVHTGTIYVILDECHVSLKEHAVLHTCFKQLGIEYGSPTSTWKKNVKVLSVSATPFAQTIHDVTDKMFERVYLERSTSYIGFEEIYAQGRFVDVPEKDTGVTFASNHDGILSPTMIDFLEEFQENCINYGEGYAVIRCTDDITTSCIKKLLIEYNSNFQVRQFHCAQKNGAETLQAFKEILNKQPNRATICIITNAASAGDTLNTQFIRGWWEAGASENSTVSTFAQRAGRCCGYNKQNDKFPIYCNFKLLQQVRDFYLSNYKICGKGTRSSSNFSKENSIEISETFPEKEDMSNHRLTLSNWKKQNLADEILQKRILPSIGNAWVLIDKAPSRQDYHNSFEELKQKYPNIVGKWVRVTKGTGDIVIDNNNKLAKDIMFGK